MQLVEGKVAIVTGGSKGIGFVIAKTLLENGARKVCIAARSEDDLEKAASVLRESALEGAEVVTAVCDVTNEDQVKSAFDTAADEEGEIDICVANAGLGWPGPLVMQDDAGWSTCLDLNVKGTAFSIKHAFPAMKRKGGRIITISSIAAALNDRFMAPYAASKAALEKLTENAAVEFGEWGIKVNSIAPGYIPTEHVAGVFSERIVSDFVDNSLLGTEGSCEDIANAVLFFSSDMGRWITGQILRVDGGRSIVPGIDYTDVAAMIFGEEEIAKTRKT